MFSFKKRAQESERVPKARVGKDGTRSRVSRDGAAPEKADLLEEVPKVRRSHGRPSRTTREKGETRDAVATQFGALDRGQVSETVDVRRRILSLEEAERRGRGMQERLRQLEEGEKGTRERQAKTQETLEWMQEVLEKMRVHEAPLRAVVDEGARKQKQKEKEKETRPSTRKGMEREGKEARPDPVEWARECRVSTHAGKPIGTVQRKKYGAGSLRRTQNWDQPGSKNVGAGFTSWTTDTFNEYWKLNKEYTYMHEGLNEQVFDRGAELFMYADCPSLQSKEIQEEDEVEGAVLRSVIVDIYYHDM